MAWMKVERRVLKRVDLMAAKVYLMVGKKVDKKVEM